MDRRRSGVDHLSGSDRVSHIFGGGGNDDLRGNGGNDIIYGGAGFDTVVLSGAYEDFDIVSFTGADGVYRTIVNHVRQTGTVKDGSDILIGVEKLQFRNSSLEVSPTALKLVMGSRQIEAGVTGILPIEIVGNEDPNRITGNDGNNLLTGGPGDDQIDGGAGNDTMAGGADNDIYVVDQAGDLVTENANEGIDTVCTTLASYDLGANVENLIFTDGGIHTGTGNEFANLLGGGSGNDTIFAGAGADTLIGGDGNDVLVGNAGGDDPSPRRWIPSMAERQ